MSENSEKIYKKLFYRKPGGVQETTPEEVHGRVAIFAATDKNGRMDSKLALEIEQALNNNLFRPNSPAMMNCGVFENPQTAACYVQPLKDDLESINAFVSAAGKIYAKGSGLGGQYGNLREQGADLSSGGFSSGPHSFMYPVAATGKVIRAGGTNRRAAHLGMMFDHHPNVRKHINFKWDMKNVLDPEGEPVFSGMNLSVAASDKFMTAVAEDRDWSLYGVVDGKVKDRFPAKEMLNDMAVNAVRSGCPGIWFIDRANMDNTIPSVGCIESTNPSLIKGTLVWTSEGIKKIEELEGVEFTVRNIWGGESPATCWKSGTNKSLFSIGFQGNHTHYATPEHKWPVITKDGSVVKCRSDELRVGDLVVKGGFESSISNSTEYTREDGFMTGWNIGDGWRTDRKDGRTQYGFIVTGDKRQEAVLHQLSSALLKHGCDASFADKDEVNLSSESLQNFFRGIGYSKKEDGLPSKIWDGVSEQFIRGMIDGLFSSDGSIDALNWRIIYTSKDEKIANDLSDLLSFYGIKSSVRKSVSSGVSFPNGKSYSREYQRFDLVISNYVDIVHFHSCFSLSNSLKQRKLDEILMSLPSKKRLHHSSGIRVTDVKKDEVVGDVWDINVQDETHCFKIAHAVTGNCGEQGLHNYESCMISSTNVGACITGHGLMNWEELKKIVHVQVEILDNLIDISGYPTREYKNMAQASRPIGVGTMGLADAVVKAGYVYGSKESCQFAQEIQRFITKEAIVKSAELAVDRGVFPLYTHKENRDACLAVAKKYFNLDDPHEYEQFQYVEKNGLRNSNWTTIAPNGSTSIACDCSPGMEPFFGICWEKNIKNEEKETWYIVSPLFEELYSGESWYKEGLEGIARNGGRCRGVNCIPQEIQDLWVTAHDIPWQERLEMQASLQRVVSNSISSTVNLPAGTTPDTVAELYKKAWSLGLKGVTVYIDQSISGQPVTFGGNGASKTPEFKIPFVRPKQLHGVTCKVKTGYGSLYLTFNRDPASGRIVEIFANGGKNGSKSAADVEANTRILSKALQSGAMPGGFVSTMLNINDLEMPVCWDTISGDPDAKQTQIKSVYDAIAKTLAYVADEKGDGTSTGSDSMEPAMKCPECGEVMEHVGGCPVCRSCGYTKCG